VAAGKRIDVVKARYAPESVPVAAMKFANNQRDPVYVSAARKP